MNFSYHNWQFIRVPHINCYKFYISSKIWKKSNNFILFDCIFDDYFHCFHLANFDYLKSPCFFYLHCHLLHLCVSNYKVLRNVKVNRKRCYFLELFKDEGCHIFILKSGIFWGVLREMGCVKQWTVYRNSMQFSAYDMLIHL